MKKPATLRRLLLDTALKDQGEKLTLFIDKGGVTCKPGRSLSYEIRYTLVIFIDGYTGSTDALMIPILAWIAEQQPNLLDAAEAFTFEAETLDDDSADVTIDLALSERVLVTRTGATTFEAQHLAEPALDDAFPGVCGVSLLTALVDGGTITG